jgi:ribosome-associated protein
MAGGEPLPINARLTLPARELRIEAARSGGPGGQRVNKVATKVVLRFDVAGSAALAGRRRELLLARLGSRLTAGGEIVIHASRFRDRARNLEDARERLAAMLREGLRTPRRRVKTRPTRASRERRLEDKRKRSKRKQERRRTTE